jgi:hypothetical protein
MSDRYIPIRWRCDSCGTEGSNCVSEEDHPEQIEKLMLRIQRKHRELSPNCDQLVKESSIRLTL